MDLNGLKGPSEALESKRKGFKNLLELATECLSNKDYSNAEMVYGSLFSDLQKEWLLEALNFNDLDCFSLQCCFAYASVAANPTSESSLVILNSLHSPIKIPLVPYLKAFVHISNESITSAQKDMELCSKLIHDGYNFKSNSILNEDIVPEVNNDFLKLKLNGLTFACELLKAKEDNEDLKRTFKEHWMKIGKLCEYDFAKMGSNTKEKEEEPIAKQKSSPEKKKATQSKTGAIKKTDNSNNSNKQQQKQKTVNIAIQTVPTKHVNVHVQTIEKDLNKELMSTLQDIRNKVNNLQNKKDDELKKLNKKNNELSDKILTNNEKNQEFDFLKEQYFAMEKKYEESQKQVVLLKKLLTEQIQQKHHMQKNMFILFEERCNTKVEFLTDAQKMIQPGFKISADECKQEILLWRNTLNKVQGAKKKLTLYSKNVEESNSSDSYSTLKTYDWPELPSMPIETQDFVHRHFRNILVEWGQICAAPINFPPSFDKFKQKIHTNQNFIVGNHHKTNEDERNTSSPRHKPEQVQMWKQNPAHVVDHQKMQFAAVRNTIVPNPIGPASGQDPQKYRQPQSPSPVGSASGQDSQKYRQPQSPSPVGQNLDPQKFTQPPPYFHNPNSENVTNQNGFTNFPPPVPPRNFTSMEDLFGNIQNAFLNPNVRQQKNRNSGHFEQQMPVVQNNQKSVDMSSFWDPGPNVGGFVKQNQANNSFQADSTPSGTEVNGYKTEKELLEYLKSKFEHIDEIHLQQVTMRVRDANGGTLQGVSRDKLVDVIRSSLKRDKPAWTEVTPNHKKWHNDHTENRCCICFDDFNPTNSYTLSCQHEFHKQCIKDWLKRQSACPVCRVHTVIDEEFPPLNKF